MNKFMKLMVSFSFAFLAIFSVGALTDITNPNVIVLAEEEETNGGTSLFKDTDAIDTSKATSDTEAKKIVGSLYNVANVFAGIVLAISVIMIILGGLKYIMANGDPRQAESGKMILIYSGIGIVISLSAFVIARLFASFQFLATGDASVTE